MSASPEPLPPSPQVQRVLDLARERAGFVPNAVLEMARSPAVAHLVLGAKQAMQGAILTAAEQHAVELFLAVRAGCDYCRTYHAALGPRAGLEAGEVRRLLAGERPESARLRHLLFATEQILDKGGALAAPELDALEARGVERAQLYELVALVGLNFVTNTINRIAATPPDAPFARAARALEEAREP